MAKPSSFWWIWYNNQFDKYRPTTGKFLQYRWHHYHLCKRKDINTTASLYLDTTAEELRNALLKDKSTYLKTLTFLSKPLLACFFLSCIVVTLVVFLDHTWYQARHHRDADIKYRYLKLYGNPALVKRLDVMDSLCLTDPDAMRNEVEQEEDRRQEAARKWEKLQEKKAEVKELEGEGSGF